MEIKRKGPWIEAGDPRDIACEDCSSVLQVTIEDVFVRRNESPSMQPVWMYWCRCPVCKGIIEAQQYWAPQVGGHPYRQTDKGD